MKLKNYGNIKLMSFKYNKLNAQCMWCKRTKIILIQIIKMRFYLEKYSFLKI